MKKVAKYALAAAGAFLLCAGLVLGYLVLTFDVRDYEPRIVALVKEKTGRTLTIRGETALSLWPDLGLTLGPVALSERGSDAVFAEVANARLSAKLRPLFDKALVADELFLEGASVRITRDKDGRLNIDDLLAGEGGALDFDIARARVTKSRIVYEDLALGTRHQVSGIEIVTGRLVNAATSPVTVAFDARDGAGAYAVAIEAQGRLTFDSRQRTYAFDAASARLRGKLATLSDVDATIKGGAAWTPGVFRVNASAIEGRFKAAGRPFELDAASTLLETSTEGTTAESVAAALRSSTGDDRLQARFNSPRVEWRQGVLAARESTVELDLVRDARKVHATVAGALRATEGARVFELSDARTKFSARGAGLPKRGVEGAVAGNATFDTRSLRVEAKLAGTVLDTRVKAAFHGVSPSSYTFALDLDTLDLDRLGLAAGKDTGVDFDLAELSGSPAAGTLRIGTLRRASVVAKNVQLALKP
ncbi:MAG TPA: AsmA family protein [Burkholderiales bacterium]|nr:AsmA family protein [Burkholderiales bacterium]